MPKKVKTKDKVDEIVDEIEKEEDDKLEDLVLTDMASDPDDITFAMQDMKVRGLKKTMSKLPEHSKKEYVSKLMGESGEEEREGPEDDYSMERRPGPGRDSEEEYDEGSMPMQYGRQEYPDSASREDERVYYDSRELTRGGYPPPPPLPPNPLYSGEEEVEEEQLYKRNLKILDQNLAAADFHRRRMGQRRQRNMGASVDRGYLQQKRNEAAEAKNVFDKTRVAAEIGAETRSSRQCRAFFRECPVKTLAKAPTTAGGEAEGESSADNQPFLNRAVNNIRRVLLGSPQTGTKQKRVNEIKEAIQQLNPPRNHGGSEVKVVLNIGPTPPDLHRAGVVMQPYGQPDPNALNGLVSPGIMAPQGPPTPGLVNVLFPNGQLSAQQQPYVPLNPPGPTQLYPASSSMPPPPPRFSSSIPPRFSSSPPPPSKIPQMPPVKPTTFHDMLTSSITPVKSTSPRPTSPPTRKTMVYYNPSSTKATKTSSPTPKISSPSSVELDSLEQMLKTTIEPEFEEVTTNFHSVEVSNDSNAPVSFVEEEDEREETLDDLLPSKTPITKDEYAQNLRETLNIFDRFKQAHQPKPTTVKPTPKPVKVAKKSHTSTKKASSNRVATSNRPQKHGTTGTRGKGASKRPSNSKGETEDVPQEDIYEIIDFIKLLRKRNRNSKAKKKANKGKGGKGKGHKKGGDDDSSEESSEEDYYSQGPIVAVPPPTDRFKVMWKSSSALLKDGFYHLLFSNKRAKPLPIPIVHHQSPGSVHVDDHDYHDEYPEHDEPSQGDEPHDDEPHEDEPHEDEPHEDEPHEDDERPKDDEPAEDDDHHKDDEHDADDDELAEDDEHHKDDVDEPTDDDKAYEDDKVSEDEEPLEDDDSPEEDDEPPKENKTPKNKSKQTKAKGSKTKQKKVSPKKRTRPYHRPGRSGSKKKTGSSKLLIAVPDGAPSFKMSQLEPSMFPDEFNEEVVPHHKYYDSVESSSFEMPSGESTEPELVYSPFSSSRYKPKSTAKSKSKGRRTSLGMRSKVKKKRKGGVKRIGEVSSKATTSATTTAKPRRRVLKYRG
ncbi:unnamed protein product [Orchesella dallaii]